MLGLLAACGGRRGPDKPAPSSLTVTVVRPSMQEIERELGDRFDLGRYHEAVISHGSVPTKYLPELVRARLHSPR